MAADLETKEISVKPKFGFYAKYIKRPLDVCCALAVIIVFCWLYLILIILGAVFMKGNPFFVQERPGKDEKIFKLIKFRTMDNRRDENGNFLSDSVRLNKYGRFLRKTSLDELPELINILIGNMSFIGPRPLLVKYLPYYTEREHHRHDVRPGLSGLAQVNGRNFISWETIFEFDLFYVYNVSFNLDMKVFFHTILKVLMRSDIEDAVTLETDNQYTHDSLDAERGKVNAN